MPIFRHGRNFFTNNLPSDQWLPVFGGELILQYAQATNFRDKMTPKSIMPGSEARFPLFGVIGSEIHEQGEEMLGMDVEQAERVIYPDRRPLVTHFNWDGIDELFMHYDGRAPIVEQMAVELARQTDKKDAVLIAKAARTAKVAGSQFFGGGIQDSGSSAGTALENATFANDTDAAALAVIAAIDAVLVRLDQIEAPEGIPLFCYVRPGLWHRFRNLQGLVTPSTSYPASPTPIMGMPTFDPGAPTLGQRVPRSKFWSYKGVQIGQSNRLPSTNDSSNPDTKYAGDFSKTKGLIWSPGAAAHVDVLGMVTETDRDVKKGLDFVVSKVQTGGGTLRPELAFELVTP